MAFKALFIEEEPRNLGTRFKYISDDTSVRSAALDALEHREPGAVHPLRSVKLGYAFEPPDFLSRLPIVVSKQLVEIFEAHRVDATYHPVEVHDALGDAQFFAMHLYPVIDCIDLDRCKLPAGRSPTDYPMDRGARESIPLDEVVTWTIDEVAMEGHDLAFAKYTTLLLARDNLAAAIESRNLTGLVIVDMSEPYPFGEPDIPVDLEALASAPTPGRIEYWARQAIDWAWLEDRIVELGRARIDRLALEARREPIYGFAFACNAEYGGVICAANSKTRLRERAQASKSNRPSLYGDSTLEEVMSSHRWSIGDWDLYDDTDDPPFAEIWEPVRETMVTLMDECGDDAEGQSQFRMVVEQFLVVACRALLRLERAGAFAKLHTTADFSVICVDHDEADGDSLARMDRVRQLSP